MKKLKVSMVFNVLIFGLVLFATICMLGGIYFQGGEQSLFAERLEAFRFFTVDSNVFVGIASLVLFVFEYRLFKNKISKIPNLIYVLKFVATVSVVLTFTVTVFYLAPTSEFGYFSLFKNSNLFYHLIIPILSFISFVFFEGCEFKFRYTFTGLIPAFIYGIFYSIWVLLHVDGGKVSLKYDWYGFLAYGVDTIFVVIPILFLLTYIICILLWKFNRKFGS